MKVRIKRFIGAAPILLAAILVGCGGGGESETQAAQGSQSTSLAKKKGTGLPVDPAVEAGEFLFKDPTLSASKRMACVTCHAENAGHADAAGVKLPMGGPLLNVSGMRSSPTVRYLNENPPFSIDANGVPRGGFTWDGRADSRKEQAAAPFFEHPEMALPGSPAEPKALTDLVRAAPYYQSIAALFKPSDLNTDAKLFDKITTLLELYQRDDADYNLFESTYDSFLKGQGTLSASEMRGLALFKDANKGNCISCHSAQGEKQLFTDFGYAALAVPRNHEGPKNVDPAYFDLGLCMRERAKNLDRKIAASAPRYCGMFKTPTLRNIDRTAPYFHNGSMATLEAAVRFHFERDTQPEKYYLKADGTVDRPYNDLPTQHVGNIARGKPFDGSFVPTNDDINDLIAFLKTLTDSDQTNP